MKWTFRILMIAALAMALGIFAHANSGYVQIAMPQTFTLEMSLNFFIIALALAFFVFYVLLRGVGALWTLPQRRLQKQNEALQCEESVITKKSDRRSVT
ncbi:MAG: hypothetical protein LBI16_05525 [Burkholderiales bacterium]|jgi:HemY protein|nr:hypothetical protein [Burkholderiales bacterium]